MAWRGLHLTQAARLTLADGQLVVAREESVVRVALENAVSVASVLLLTEATMTEIPEKDQVNEGFAAGHAV